MKRSNETIRPERRREIAKKAASARWAKKAEKRNKPLEANFHCTPEWHLDGPELRLYTFAYKISKGNEFNFYAAKTTIAEYFGVDRTTVKRWADRLVEVGFFELVAEYEGDAWHYKVIPHTHWEKAHPNRCVKKISSVLSGDELGAKLFGISGGKVMWMPHKLKMLRDLAIEDSEIMDYFNEFWTAEIEAGNHVGSRRQQAAVTEKFYQWLKERTHQQRRAAV